MTYKKGEGWRALSAIWKCYEMNWFQIMGLWALQSRIVIWITQFRIIFIFLHLQDMVFDFMQQIMSRLDSLEKKIDGNQQCFEKLSKRIEKRKVSVEYVFPCKLQLLVIPSSCNTYTQWNNSILFRNCLTPTTKTYSRV